jgi:hypothetical protein
VFLFPFRRGVGLSAGQGVADGDLMARALAADGQHRCTSSTQRNDYSISSGKALAAEMQRLGRPHWLKIYPAAGRSAREGHNLVFRNVATWEPDVFAILDSRLRH